MDQRISWSEANVYVDLSRAAIKQSPEYKEGAPLSREYEDELHRHYNLQRILVDEPVIKKRSRKSNRRKDILTCVIAR